MGRTEDGTRTNVLMIVTDQEQSSLTSPETLDVYRENTDLDVNTENIDTLYEEGMYFSNAYTISSICSPARATLFTGQSPGKHGVKNNTHGPEAIKTSLREADEDFSVLIEELAKNGVSYRHIGKQHFARDQDVEDFGGEYIGGGDTQYQSVDPGYIQYRNEKLSELDTDISPDDAPFTKDEIVTKNGILVAATNTLPIEATHAYYMAEKAIEQLERLNDEENSGVIGVHFPGPHHPYLPPEEYAEKYDADELDVWSNFEDTFGNKPRIHAKYIKNRGVEDFDREVWSEAIAQYLGYMDFIDDQIGRILEHVDDEKLDMKDDLAVIHMADHGDFTGAHRQFNKGPLMYEETYSIPFQIRWPGVIEEGGTSDAHVSVMDVMPTILDMVDAPIPGDVDGRSMVPLFKGTGEERSWNSVFAEYHGDEFGRYPQQMVKTDRFKFVHNRGDIHELYDLQDDPHELNNVINEPAYQDVRRKMAEGLLDWRERLDDPHLTDWIRATLREDLEAKTPEDTDMSVSQDIDLEEVSGPVQEVTSDD